MFEKILIANRGEIACRIAATCRRLGVRTVGVYSDVDRHARHVALCDTARAIGGAQAKDSYLNAERIIAAALASGAQAIHPGYGFLSENAGFADQCAQAGLVFIGPPASSIEAMGSKSAAKRLMEQAGVPLVPGYHGQDQDPTRLRTEANRIGYPVLLKASAGGGGKGMRVIERDADFADALGSVQREAAAAFGDDAVLIEKYLMRPRHVEIQVFADTHGHCVHLFERDCSVQRRHQKVLEEAPAPGMTPERRQAMGAAAIAAARAVGYVGAGTVEFIVDQSGEFYFMEMNTRLQVEHPVTEMITGLDLVEWQLRVASGQPLPLEQERLSIDGHALEARIYAENADHGFLPSTGRLELLRTPRAAEFVVEAPGGTAAVRIDSGVREGDEISAFYDPMIAKLIVWGRDRAEALARMDEALGATVALGPHTNIAFLRRLVRTPAFATAELDTGLIPRNESILFPDPVVAGNEVAMAVARILHRQTIARLSLSDVPARPWSALSAWSLNGAHRTVLTLRMGEQELVAEYRRDGADQTLSLDGHSLAFKWSIHNETVSVYLGDETATGTVYVQGDTIQVITGERRTTFRLVDPLTQANTVQEHAGRLVAPMPGKIVAVLVAQGDEVTRGTPLVVMEAMKMEHTVVAPADGVVQTLLHQAGDQVVEGAQLLILEGGD